MEIKNTSPLGRIQQFQLPKLRHKSTHNQHQSSTHKKSMRRSVQRKHQHHHSNLLFSKPTLMKHHKSLSRVQQSMLKYRKQFNQITNINKNLLNLTFHKHSQQNNEIQKRKKLQKRKVYNMQKTQHVSSLNQKHKNQFNLQKLNKNEDLYTGPMIVLDYKIQMSFLNHTCLDGEFPLARVGATLSCYNNQIYLFGGCPDIVQGNNLIFHKFCQNSNKWKHIKTTGQKPFLSLMYHTVNTHKDFFVFAGGICIQKFEIKKFNNPHIHIYNNLTSLWSQFNWGYYLKHHSTCMINNVLIIHGGINQRQRTQNQIHFIHLNFNGHLPFSRIVTFDSNQFLSHHKMITTINEDSRLRSKFKIDGIIMFGGKKHTHEKFSNDLYYIETNSFKLNDDDTTITKKWHIAQIRGPKPEPRICHTFDLLTNKGLCVLIGGINQKNQYLNDMWIFDLFGLTWTKVEQVPLLRQTGGIAYHSTTVNQSEIYLYGGITKNQTNKQFYLIETQKFKRQYSKHQSRKRIDISSNMISFKAFQ